MKILQFHGYTGNENIVKVDFGNSCTAIGDNAFNRCTNLKSEIIIREGTTLGTRAFNNSGITKLTVENGITINDGCDFENCENLESITIGDNVTIKGSNSGYSNRSTFGNCTSLRTVTMGENIKMPNNYGGPRWFSGCTALEEVTVKSLSEVGVNAFYNVGAKLKGKNEDIIINEGVTIIKAYAFKGCTNIKKVKIPSTVTTIEYEVFNGCTGLEKIQVDMTEAEFNNVAKGNNWNKGVTAAIEYLK